MNTRRVLAVSAFFIVGAFAFGQAADSGSAPDTATILLLLDSKISGRLFLTPEGRAQMQEASAGLTEDQRLLLFNSHKKDDAVVGLVVNLLVPGLGSALQSDWGGGGLELATYLVGGAAFGLGVASAESDNLLPTPLDAVLGIGGFIVVLSSLVMGVLRPFFWVSEWNRDLSRALGTRVALFDLSTVPAQRNPTGTSWSAELDLVSFRY